MNPLQISIAIMVGAGLGIIFYGGLWLTVRRTLVTRNPVALTLGSILIRMTIVLAGILIVARGRWQNVIACLLGLTIGRLAVSRFCRRGAS